MRRPALLAAIVLMSTFAVACSSSPTSPAPSKLRPADATLDVVVTDTVKRGYTAPGG